MSEQDIHYRVKPVDLFAHLLEITCIVNKSDPEGLVFSMPAWIPGSYMIRDFAKNIVSVTVTSDNVLLSYELLDKQTWRCCPASSPIIITCQVYAWDLSVRTAHVDETHAYFNGISVFFCIHGQENSPCSIELLPPDGDACKDWRVATAMSRDTAGLHGFGLYHACNYDELIDHPVEMGDFSLAIKKGVTIKKGVRSCYLPFSDVTLILLWPDRSE